MKTNKLSYRLVLGLITLLWILGVAPSSYASISYDFNSGSSDFVSTFQQNTFSSDSFFYYTNGGLSDSGSVRGGGAVYDAALLKTPLSTISGTDVILALYFKTQASVAFGDIAGVGISSTLSSKWFDQGTGMINVNGNNGFVSYIGGGSGGAGSTATLLGNEWYQLVVDFHNYGNGWGATGNLYDYGANGSSSPTSAGSFSNQGLGDLGTTNSVYVGIYGGTGGGNSQFAQRLDNFTATATVPEPSTYGLMFLGALFVMFTAYRRCRA